MLVKNFSKSLGSTFYSNTKQRIAKSWTSVQARPVAGPDENKWKYGWAVLGSVAGAAATLG